jgi:hypothetical protein
VYFLKIVKNATLNWGIKIIINIAPWGMMMTCPKGFAHQIDDPMGRMIVDLSHEPAQGLDL